MQFQTPILLLIFNRPDLTEVVFAQIKKGAIKINAWKMDSSLSKHGSNM
jgi:hypothetical protein